MDQEKTPQQSVPPGELEHLEQILRMVNEELEEAQRSVDKMDDEYKEAQQYIADSHGEGDPKEMFQTRMLMGQIDNRGASAVVYRDRLKKTKSSPYFARIDFAPQDERKAPPTTSACMPSASSSSCTSSTGAPRWPACFTTSSWGRPTMTRPRATPRAA